MHCGMEVVLPSGEVLRTGMGALPNSNTWQTFQYGNYVPARLGVRVLIPNRFRTLPRWDLYTIEFWHSH